MNKVAREGLKNHIICYAYRLFGTC